MRNGMTLDYEPCAASLSVPPFLFYITNGVGGYGQPFNPVGIGHCRRRARRLGRAAVNEFSFVTLATKGMGELT